MSSTDHRFHDRIEFGSKMGIEDKDIKSVVV